MDIQRDEEFEKAYSEICKPIIARPYPRNEKGEYVYQEIHEAHLMWQAKAQAVPEVKPSHSITLTCAQLREAFMFGAPDKDDQEQLETEMTIVWSKEGHSGKGYYCYYSELPEEGAIFLDEVIEVQEQKG